MTIIKFLADNPLGPYPEDLILSSKSNRLALRKLKLERRRQPIGLDATEFVASPPKDDPTTFYGILKIESLTWLAPEGWKILQDDLYALARDTNKHHIFDLKKIYRDPKVKIFFLARYRLWVLIEELIQQDPHTSTEERTIEWLVSQYSYRLQEQSIGCFPRHVSRAEMTGLFATHAEWILAQHLVTHGVTPKKLNIPKWIEFCNEVADVRLKAWHTSASIGWGVPDGEKPDLTKRLDLSQFGVITDGASWETRIQNALKPKKNRKTRPLSPHVGTAYPTAARTHLPTAAEFIYDSDFSEPSTSSYSESSNDEDLVLDIPPTLAFWLRHPVIHDGQFEWQCSACNYSIDLLDLREDVTKALSPAEESILRGGKWKSPKDESVQRMLVAMVKDHCVTVHVR
ncbi:hypothetical protein H0H87_000152 [Tephrocybe sp. NHM501043]|nr:hypothetical protein H0H87_000152 [Tephrocybe sp. NHM501043]